MLVNKILHNNADMITSITGMQGRYPNHYMTLSKPKRSGNFHCLCCYNATVSVTKSQQQPNSSKPEMSLWKFYECNIQDVRICLPITCVLLVPIDWIMNAANASKEFHDCLFRLPAFISFYFNLRYGHATLYIFKDWLMRCQ